MGTIATLAINIIGNIQGLEQALGKAQQSLRSAGDNLANLGGRLTAGVSLPILGVGGAALKAAADNEQLQVAFTTMLGSAENAKSLMADLSKFAAATPFESDEIQGAAKMLLAYGSSAGSVTDEMRQLGDIAAGVGVPLKDLAYLYGTSRVQGRLFTADINQFTSRGVPIIEALAETMGVAQGEIRGMVEAGKIGFPELQAALGYLTGEGGKFSGLMEAQSTTLTGLFSTLKDNVSLAMIDIGNAIAQAFDLKTNAAAAITFVEGIRNTISGLAQTNPQLLRMGVILAAVAAAVGPLLLGLGMLLKAAAALTPVVSVLGAAFGALFSPVGLVVAAVAALTAAFVFDWGGIRTTVLGVAEGLLALAGVRLDGVLDGLGAFVEYLRLVAADGDYLNDWLTHLPQPVQGAVVALGQVAAALRTLVTTGDIGGFIVTMQEIDWGGALDSVRESLGELGSRIAAILQGIDWGSILAAAGDWLGSLAAGIASALAAIDWGGALATAAGWLGGLASGIAGAVASLDWGGALAAAGDWLAGLTAGVVGAIQGIDWGGLLAAAGDYLASLWGGVVTAVTAIDWGGHLAAAGDFVAALAGGVIGVVTTIDWGGLLTAAGDYLAALWGGVMAALGAIPWAAALTGAAGWLDDLTAGVVGAIREFDWGGALSAAGSAFAGLETAVADGLRGLGFDGAATALDGLAGALSTALPQAASAAQAAMGTINAALYSAKSAFDSAESAAGAFLETSAWTTAQSEITTALGAIGASVTGVFSGDVSLSELSDTLVTQFGEIRTTLAGLFASEEWAALGSSLLAAFGLEGLAATVTTKVEAVQAAFQPLLDFLEPAFTRLGETVGGLPAQFDGLVAKFEPLKAAAGELAAALGGLFGGGGEAGGGGMTGNVVLGAALAGTLSLLTNTVNGLLGALAPLAGTFIDELTTVLSGLATVVTGLGTAFAGITANDPTLVLQGLGTAFQGVKDIVSGTFENSLTAVQTALTAIGTIVTTTLSDWGFGAAATAVDGMVTSITTLLEKIKLIASGDTSIDFTAPDWITKLLEWLWPSLDVPDWVESLLAWKWPALEVPDWITSLLAWKWPSLDLPEWVDNLMAWKWPSFDMPDWLSDLFAFKWPSLPQLPPWLGGPPVENQAVGTSYFSGGFVNASETRPEVAILPRGVSWLPRGSQILNGRDSEAFMAGAGAGGGVTVIFQGATIRSERDVQRLAREIDDIQQRRRRA